MKWFREFDGQGRYWWKAETPLGPVYAEFEDDAAPGARWYAYWHPYDRDKETEIGRYGSETEATEAAEKWIKSYALNESMRLARFAK